MAKSKVPVRLPGDPANALDATPKQYVDLRSVPSGGTTGQALVKVSATDYDFAWADQSGSGGGGPHTHTETDVTNLTADLAALDARLDTLEAAPPPVLDHGELEGLADDDHPQYLNNARGDARYAALGHLHDAADISTGVFDIARIPVGTLTDTVAAGDDPRLSDARTPLAHTHTIANVTGLQTALDGKEANGTAAAAVSAHEGAVDPHPQYLTVAEGGAAYDPLGAADSAIQVHEAAANPHPGYLTAAEADAAYAALSHNHSATQITSGTLAIARIPTGTTGTTVALGNDSRFTDARTPLAHTHAAADINSGTLAFARLPVGTTSTTVAVGNHTHEGMSSGGGFASGTIPDTSATPTVEHGLGTRDLIVQVREVATDLLVRVAVETIDDNNLRFTFSTTPTAGQYRYTVLSAAATLGTGAHTHAEADITGLAADLSNKSDIGHTHVVADTTALQDALDSKSPTTHDHGSTYLTPAAGDAAYATIDHTHTLTELGAAAETHVHSGADITTGTVAYGRLPVGTTINTVAAGNDSRITSAVPNSRTLTAGTGLTGGGDLTANRSFAVAYGTTAGTAAQGNDSRLSDARTPTAHKTTHATGGSDALSPADIGAATSGHTHTPDAVPVAPRTASASTTYTADGTVAGDIQLTCTGDTVITPSGTPNGRMMIIEAKASTAQRSPSVAASVLLASNVASRTLVVPTNSVGVFGLRYSSLRGGWMLIAAAVV